MLAKVDLAGATQHAEEVAKLFVELVDLCGRSATNKLSQCIPSQPLAHNLMHAWTPGAVEGVNIALGLLGALLVELELCRGKRQMLT
jgi:hypothetical protein